jgi:hypothetical protein
MMHKMQNLLANSLLPLQQATYTAWDALSTKLHVSTPSALRCIANASNAHTF